jgi:two-component system OmpR family response regulator
MEKRGLRTVKEQKFDLILLDLAMPEFSGVDVVNSLEKEGILSTNNVVIFTASSDPIIIDGLKKSGVKEILKKPISIDDLTSFIDKYRSETQGS